MSYNLGEYIPKQRNNPEVAVRNIESKLDFVMITERFDESLILLRRHFLPYLDLEDLIYMSQNQAAKTSKIKDSESDRKQCNRIESLNVVDTVVYKHFYNKFEEMVEEFGVEKMEEEVKKLKNLNKQVSDKCFDKPVVNKNLANMFGFWWPRNSTHGIKVPMVKKSMLSNKLCRNLARSEK